jgi:BolA family transcriptional regulator, general stress-responsive regulator
LENDMSVDSGTTAREIERILREKLAPTKLEVIDESMRHAGHAGASEGGHFRVVVVSTAFAGKSPVERHRLVNAALAPLFAGRIHALQLRTLTPEEA